MAEDRKAGADKEAAGDAYAGSFGESVYALWHDPTTFDPLKMGPPYLPQAKRAAVRVAAEDRDAIRTQARRQADASPLQQMLLTMVADYQGAPMAELAAVLACLRAAAVVHQSHHWQTRGDTFYGDHLLYERLYNDSLGFIDQIAERAVGAGHHLLVHPVIQTSHVAVLVKHFCGGVLADPKPDTYALISLTAELQTLGAINMAHEALEQKSSLSQGTDNLLQGIADKHEEFVYLLKQRCSSKVSYRRGPADPRNTG